jgi:hypothetical protein
MKCLWKVSWNKKKEEEKKTTVVVDGQCDFRPLFNRQVQ